MNAFRSYRKKMHLKRSAQDTSFTNVETSVVNSKIHSKRSAPDTSFTSLEPSVVNSKIYQTTPLSVTRLEFESHLIEGKFQSKTE